VELRNDWLGLVPLDRSAEIARRRVHSRAIDGTLFVNPGSVGLAYDHRQEEDEFLFRPVAEYALVIADDFGPAVEFRQVPYSSADMQAAAKANGHPYAEEWTSQWAER
jgi:hypothetical protein